MKYDWKDAGEEWSEPWGSSAAQWTEAILPRLKGYVPATTILEIGSGFGRWTHYLKDYCEHLLVLDKSPEFIEACRQRFGDDSKLAYFVNDGRSLGMLPDESVDFVFSFDSLVYPDRAVIDSYLGELAKKLRIGGKGFFQSNLAAYKDSRAHVCPSRSRKSCAN